MFHLEDPTIVYLITRDGSSRLWPFFGRGGQKKKLIEKNILCFDTKKQNQNIELKKMPFYPRKKMPFYHCNAPAAILPLKKMPFYHCNAPATKFDQHSCCNSINKTLGFPKYLRDLNTKNDSI